MKSTKRKVLVIGCHCDDIELGCGGTLHKMQDEWDIKALILSSNGPNGCYPDLHTICRLAMAELGIDSVWFDALPPRDFALHRQSLHEILSNHRLFDTVFIPERDEHQDHAIVYEESLRAFRGGVTLYAYPAPYSCPNPPPQTNSCPLDASNLGAKLAALAHYTMYADRPYMNPDFIRARCVVAAVRSAHTYAESFRLIQSTTL